MHAKGHLQKLKSTLLETSVDYTLPIGNTHIPLNRYLGKTITLSFQHEIQCTYCQRLTPKSYHQGYCFPCSQKLARTDLCIVRPERCHYHLGTCREAEWGKMHCMISHIVYIANTSGCKVGITRETQVPTRWIDQGAVQALPILRVQSRFQSGQIEMILKNYIQDKTDWRKMLKENPEALDLLSKRDALLEECASLLSNLENVSLEPLDCSVTEIQYPVLQYPEKVKALSFEKTPIVAGVLWGIKGQYLILDTGVLNIRNVTGYHISIESK